MSQRSTRSRPTPGREAPRRDPGADAPPAALLVLLERLVEESLQVLLPGAVHGRDAVAWAAAGHEVVTVDPVPHALTACRRRGRQLGVRIQVREADPLRPPRDLEAAFDAVWEQACFARLAPHERARYVRAMAYVLRPGGVFYGLFGSPYGVTEACVRSHFHGTFEVVSIEWAPSGAPGTGEFLAVLRRRNWRRRDAQF